MIPRIALFALCAQLIYSSLAYGAIFATSWTILVAANCFLLVLFLCDKSLKQFSLPIPIPLLISLILLLLYFVLQLYMPREWEIKADPKIQEALHQQGISFTYPGLINFFYAKLAIYRWLIPIIAILLAPYALFSKKGHIALFSTILALTTLQGCYGIIQFFSTSDPFVFLIPPNQENKVAGTYVNRNTYACFVAMGVPLAIGYLLELYKQRTAIDESYSSMAKIRHYVLDHPQLGLLGILAFCATVMGVAVVVSASRGGMLSMAVGVCVFLLCYHFFEPQSSLKKSIFWLGLLVLPMMVYLYIAGIEKVLHRFLQLPQHSMGRIDIWIASFNIFRDNPIWGCGGGCYVYALEMYRPINMLPFFYAHNDYIHFLVEYGCLGAICITGVFTIWLYYALKIIRQKRSIFSLPINCALLGAISVIFCHALMDFSLHINGHRLLCAILMGSLLAQKQRDPSENYQSTEL